ncbi:MAG: DNA-protecting protein DprA [Opitutales bacterium]|nr:DNA-protecting protein DprA [Opitutales bacterium]
MTSTPYNPTRALELLRAGTQNPAASFREGQEEAIRHIVEGRGRLFVMEKTKRRSFSHGPGLHRKQLKMNAISDNTKAILLLTAPLIVSKKAEPAKILTLKEYNLLAKSLRDIDLQPCDLLGAEAATIFPILPPALDRANLESLLQRGFLLGQALAEWQRRSLWVASRADPTYPKRLKTKLREQSPPILYGYGEPSLLETGGLAVVGSRNVSDPLKTYTESIGALAAEAGITIVSGAARGIDSSAMGGALENGGCVVGVMADSLGRAALAKSNREAIQEGRLALISAYDPAAGFNVGHAMQRNKAIYALAHAGLVVSSDFNKGGTWTGAIEQLEKLRYAPVFVRNGEEAGKGAAALIQRGGKPWPEPQTAEALVTTLQNAALDNPKQAKQAELFLGVNETPQTYAGEAEKAGSEKQEKVETGSRTPAERLMQAVAEILRELLAEPKDADEIAGLLQVSKAQTTTWLKQLVEDGQIEKLTKPVRYKTPSHE